MVVWRLDKIRLIVRMLAIADETRYYPALICGFLNCLQFIGFMSLTVILGGQSLSLASSSSLSWTVGIIVVSIVSLLACPLMITNPPYTTIYHFNQFVLIVE